MMENSKCYKFKKNTILIVDDEDNVRISFVEMLKDHHNILTAENGKIALEIITEIKIDLVMLDILMPDIDGLEVLKKIKEMNDGIQVIMVTAVKDIDTGIKAMKFGAYDYITKPFDIEDTLATIKRALETRNLTKENLGLKKEIDYLVGETNIIGETEIIKKVLETVDKVADTPATVLIYGESGVGKELIARRIHQKSSRRNKPFVVVNCAAIPSELVESELFGHEKGAFTTALSRQIGKFEYADAGTLFFDDVSNLSLQTQAKVLRVIQEREIVRLGSNKSIPIDVRIISSTNIDLEKALKEKTFREDLYYRLRVVPISLPSLRERKEDIPLLIDYFINKANKKLHRNIKGIIPDIIEILKNYDWPGNIRELENVIEMMIVLAGKGKEYLGFEDIPANVLIRRYDLENAEVLSLKQARSIFEKQFIEKLLGKTNWNQSESAKLLNVHRNTLINKMRAMSLKVRRGRKKKIIA